MTLYADGNGQGKMDKHKYKSITARAVLKKVKNDRLQKPKLLMNNVF